MKQIKYHTNGLWNKQMYISGLSLWINGMQIQAYQPEPNAFLVLNCYDLVIL